MAYHRVRTGPLHRNGYRPLPWEVARVRAPVARAEGARSSADDALAEILSALSWLRGGGCADCPTHLLSVYAEG